MHRGPAGLALVFIVGCAPASQHTAEPYRTDAAAGEALSIRAAAACEARRGPDDPAPIRAFVTDGCSRFPDTEWNAECCVEHDVVYWCGGRREDRRAADEAFGRCVAERSNGFLGWMMRTGVRMGGHPVWPSSYRWGYGHPYAGGYPDDPRPAAAGQ